MGASLVEEMPEALTSLVEEMAEALQAMPFEEALPYEEEAVEAVPWKESLEAARCGGC